VSVAILDGELWVFVLPSPKLTDLVRDRRTRSTPTRTRTRLMSSWSVAGRATSTTSARARRSGRNGHFEVDDSYALLALSIESVVLGQPRADEWPPRYSRWSASGA
jgi:hypothetical protein